MVSQFKTTQAKLESIQNEINQKEATKLNIKHFLKTLIKQDKLITEFDLIQFQSLVEFITVYNREDIRITFKNGMEIKS